MAGMMRRAAVYLGLTDEQRFEDERYYDDYEDEYETEPAEPAAVAEPVHPEPEPGSGGALVVAQNDRRSFAAASNVTVMPDRSERSSRADRAERGGPVMYSVPTDRSADREASYRITTLHPRTYNEARTIGEHFREGVPVIMNLTEMEDADAKRLVDFAAGLIFGLRGNMERVTQKVFLLSPANVDVTAEDKARIAEGGFFNQS
ncbi:cell division protein SepF [Catenulispora sp. NL8]|uniref:Cell division protein SepF n=1 Tax=Catenulispora pinistramenti TaxID=2705254 RepID=A0ABS5KVB6_9ACTN|nr:MULTISPECIES: cell division protein SepF [Catenulispora]MBS2549977.1 cell division protein SepF [Catenulispora pinistramenti]